METHTGVNWDELLIQVPREKFIPDVIWRQDLDRVGNVQVPVDKQRVPRHWAEMAGVDGPVTIQVDFGKLDEDGSGWEVTAFCPGPTDTRQMLEALDPAPGERILEIGTGTGWNTALLAAAGAVVTTIEIDHELAQAAMTRLAGRSGVQEVVIGEGEDGCPARAPYDGLIATVGTATVPAEWVRQTRVGGRLVVPLTDDWQAPGIAVLERTERGATGRLTAPSAFSGLRGQAPPRTRGADFTIPVTSGRTTEHHPFDFLRDRAAATAIGQRIQGITQAWTAAPGSRMGTLWLYAEGSWATWSTLEGSPYQVSQAGPRQLFDEVEAGYQWWLDQGRPQIDAWRVEVALNGEQRLYLEG
jgi:protein-L-isoaspartate O-methyltransferase